MTVGERVRQRREERGLTLSELSRRSKVSKGYLSQIENDTAPRPSGDTLYKIASSLGTTVADLLGKRTERQVPNIPPSLQEFADEAQLPETDIKMLAQIEYRGRQPSTKADWQFLYESIRRTIRPGEGSEWQ